MILTGNSFNSFISDKNFGQWKDEFKIVTGRTMLVVVGKNDDQGLDVCATWNSVDDQKDLFQTICETDNTLVICDEHHHAAVKAAWGESADSAFSKAKYVLILTGTPIRSDGERPVWFQYSGGEITHPKDGQFTLTYGEAVDLKYCRPAFFHRHEGNFKVTLDDGTEANVSGETGQNISDDLKRIGGIDKALEFYNLACKIPYLSDGVTPDKNSYQKSMLEEGIRALDKTQERMPNAGGLVIAPNIDVAEYMTDILEDLTGEKPILVHSKLPNADTKISAYRNSNKNWIVSVNMISEGVDIRRLRVLVYLPYAQTELAFRQAMGRVVRSDGEEDDSRAYVVMPNTQVFDRYAKRIEKEMSPKMRVDTTHNKTKKCPVCEKENHISASVCECGYEFPKRQPRYKVCPNDDCRFLNPIQAKECQKCGTSFGNNFKIKLEDALRMGAIVRGMELSEDEVRESEKIADQVRADIFATGDEVLIRMTRKVPDECLARFRKILNNEYNR